MRHADGETTHNRDVVVPLKERQSMRSTRRRLASLTAAGALVLAPLAGIPALADTFEPADGAETTETEEPDESTPLDPAEAADPAETEEALASAGTDEAEPGAEEAGEAAGALDEADSLAPQALASAGPLGDLTIMATTDVHGHIYNWDYFTGEAFTGNDVLGLTHVMSYVEKVRAERGAESVLLFDNGDAIQGTPLTYVSAKHPASLPSDLEGTNPMATAFNTMGYDVQNLGNHEFNYGLEYLDDYRDLLDAPLLGANVVKAGTDEPAFTPYVIVDREIAGETVKVGVLGLVTPGVRIWDKAIVEGVLDFNDMVTTARDYVPQMKADGAEVVVVLAHTGEDADGAAWDPADLGENLAISLATLVPDVDILIGGHSHVDMPTKVFHRADGGEIVLFTQPYFWARSVSEMTIPIATAEDGSHYVAWPEKDTEVAALSRGLYSRDIDPSPIIADNPVIEQWHHVAIDYVNEVVAVNQVAMATAPSVYKATPILDLIGHVMTINTEIGLAGTEYSDLPIVAQTSPFSRTSVFPEGELTVADIAGLYIYDNTLQAELLDGTQLRAYLEHSARYFAQVTDEDPWDPQTPDGHSGAMYENETRPIRDYNFDALTGVKYEIDITKPVGERIVNLRYPDGTPVGDADPIIMAANNYRANGGGGYPVQGFETVWDSQAEIRNMIVDWAQDVEVLNPSQFFENNWYLITSDEPDCYGPQCGTMASYFLARDSVEAGETIAVKGTFWTANIPVTITLDGPQRELVVLGTVDVGEDGTFSGTVTVPAETAEGTYAVTVSTEFEAVSQPLAVSAEVVEPTAPPTTTEPPTTTAPPTTPGGAGGSGGSGGSGGLPSTGSDVLSIVLVALLLAGSGAGVLAVRRRGATR